MLVCVCLCALVCVCVCVRFGVESVDLWCGEREIWSGEGRFGVGSVVGVILGVGGRFGVESVVGAIFRVVRCMCVGGVCVCVGVAEGWPTSSLLSFSSH